MEVVTGAMGSLLPKLGELLKDEYNLHKNVKKDIMFLQRELESMHAALVKVGEVPRHQLDKQVKHWAGEVRELSYNMEDVVDKFLVRVEGSEDDANAVGLKGLMKQMVGLFKKGKNHRRIADAIKEIKERLQEVSARRDRNKVDGIVANFPATTAIDPRLQAMYADAAKLVGIYGKRDQDLIKLLSEGDNNVSKKKLKMVSIVGFGGLGKTTLAKAVHDKIKGNFDCRAFVSVGRNPDSMKVFKDILIYLDKQKYNNINLTILNDRQVIDELREFLEDKRYLIIIDDIWDQKLWEYIKLAFSDKNNQGSRLITTTRNIGVAKACCSSPNDSVHPMEPLSHDDSKMLFRKRIFPDESGCPREFEQVSKEKLKKCGGVPLAIITLASVLASGQYVNSKDEWQILLKSIGRGLKEDPSLGEMQRILSFSYYDLPSHLKTCLLYLSIYPEDQIIWKQDLICKWVAEGFVQSQNLGTSLFELGETYFNELINRNMIQPIYKDSGELPACRVHDMVLDLICSLSSEENFVTILNSSGDITSSLCSARRLSLQNSNEDHETIPLLKSKSHARSITMFEPATYILSQISWFSVLRVLDLAYHNPRETRRQLNISDIEKLLHLRYMCVSNTGIRELPTEIGNLQFLQALVVNGIEELPPTVCKLRRLMLLSVDPYCKIPPDVLGKLTSLEVLERIGATTNTVQQLGNLTRLSVLNIFFPDGSFELFEDFVESLCRLRNIKRLLMFCNSSEAPCAASPGLLDLLEEHWVPPQGLQAFVSVIPSKLYTLQVWIKRDPSCLSSLSKLRLTVKGVQQEDMQILGGLPALHHLAILSTHQTQRRLVISADGYSCVACFELQCGSGAQIMFEPGALPRVRRVEFSLGVRVARDDGNGNFDLGLQGNLLSLSKCIGVNIYHGGATVGEAKEAEATVRRALQDHPNHPRILINMVPFIPEDAGDCDFLNERKRCTSNYKKKPAIIRRYGETSYHS